MLVRQVAGVQRVVARCDRAAVAGVRPGMTLAHARALLPPDGLLVEMHDESRERRALAAIAHWALRFSPIVAPDPPDGLLLDVHGCQRLFGGEVALMRAITDGVRCLGFAARAALADTYGCAWGVARYGPEPGAIVAAGEERAALAPLSTAALRLPEDAIAALREVNVTMVEHLLVLPRRSLTARFGPEVLRRLDQATGAAFETIDPVRPRAVFLVERRFDGPAQSLEGILRTTHDLADALVMRLLEAREGVRELTVVLVRADAPPVRATLVCSHPSADAAHLWALLRPKVENMHLGYGVEAVVLHATRTGRLCDHQIAAWPEPGRAGGTEAAGRRALGAFVDTVVDRLGRRRVVRVEAVESHLPEGAMRVRSVLDDADGRGADDVATVVPEARPSLLFARPYPVEVTALTPDGPPIQMRWHGETWAITDSAGPERVEPRWWEDAPVEMPRGARDYYRVQDERGCWWWIFRTHATGARSSGWFVHGAWG